MNKIVTVTLNPCIDKTIIINGFEYGGLNRTAEVCQSVGGKGINVAAVLKSFGSDVFSCGITAGREVQSYLESLGIPHSYMVTEGRLRTNYKLVNSADRITTEINEQGFVMDFESFIPFYKRAVKSASVIVLSGSAPKGMGDDVYYRLTKLAGGIPVILDADDAGLREGIKAKPYCIKPNLFELEHLTGKRLDTVEKQVDAVKQIINHGIKLVMLSLGGEGAIMAYEDKVIRIDAPAVDCISTVGAGDSMVAAIAYGIVNNLTTEDTGRMAVCAGSLTSCRSGLCNGQDVLSEYKNIDVEIRR